MKIRTIIIDDEQPICEEISYFLEQHPDIELAATFNNGYDALHYLLKNDIELVFLDIELPGMSGLELAQRLTEIPKKPRIIIFITAFARHALAAFDTPAVGFVTKPITRVKLDKALHKARMLSLPVIRPEFGLKKLCVLNNGRFVPLDPKEIIFVYVRNKQIYIRIQSGEFETNLIMQELEELLSTEQFMRVHRQYIVNLDKIAEIIPWSHGSYLLRMSDYLKQEIPVSRNKVKQLKRIMGIK